jgi:hypothetical protein
MVWTHPKNGRQMAHRSAGVGERKARVRWNLGCSSRERSRRRIVGGYSRMAVEI